MTTLADRREHSVARASRIYGAIKRAAEMHERCPTNAQLAERFATSQGAVVQSLQFLEANGMITVARSNSARVVTITASGISTYG